MNRRAFAKALGLWGAAFLVRPEGGNVPRFGDELARILQNLGASLQDIDGLRLDGNNIADVAGLVRGWVPGSGDTPLFQTTPYELCLIPGSHVIKIGRTTNQSLADGEETKLIFDTTEEPDTWNKLKLIQPDTGYDDFTVMQNGVYLVSVWARFATNTTGYRQLILTDNTGTTTSTRAGVAPPSGAACSIGVTGCFSWKVGDVFWCLGQQNSGGPPNIDGRFMTVVYLAAHR